MNKIRKSLCLFAAAGFILCISACAAKEPEAGQTEAQKTEQEAEEEPLKIGVCIYRFDDDFMTLYRKELNRCLRETYQAEVTIADGEDSQTVQNRQITELIGQGYDGLIVNPVLAEKTSEIADQCQAAGVPVVFINRRPVPSEIKRWSDQNMAAAYVGTDEKQPGTYQGEIILETPDQGDIDGDGTVSYVMISGEHDSLSAEYRSSFPVRALEEGGQKTQCLLKESGNWDWDRGKELAAKALNLYGDKIEVIFCNNDAMACGALEAVEEAGRIVGTDIYLVGVDALEEAVTAVKNGTMTGTVLNDYNTQAHIAADVLQKLIKGEKTEREYNIDFIKITAFDDSLLID